MQKSIKEWFEWAKDQVHENGDKIYPWADKALELREEFDTESSEFYIKDEFNDLADALVHAFRFRDNQDYDWHNIYEQLLQ